MVTECSYVDCQRNIEVGFHVRMPVFVYDIPKSIFTLYDKVWIAEKCAKSSGYGASRLYSVQCGHVLFMSCTRTGYVLFWYRVGMFDELYWFWLCTVLWAAHVPGMRAVLVTSMYFELYLLLPGMYLLSELYCYRGCTYYFWAVLLPGMLIWTELLPVMCYELYCYRGCTMSSTYWYWLCIMASLLVLVPTNWRVILFTSAERDKLDAWKPFEAWISAAHAPQPT